MKEYSIVIRESIFINRPKQSVWDFTQDYALRPLWDKTVLQAQLLQSLPHRIAWLKMKGGGEMKFVYKIDRSPEKASVLATEIVSTIIKEAAGAWQYRDENYGTRWQQTNALVLKNNFFNSLLVPIYKLAIRIQVRNGMKRVKAQLERPLSQ